MLPASLVLSLTALLAATPAVPDGGTPKSTPSTVQSGHASAKNAVSTRTSAPPARTLAKIPAALSSATSFSRVAFSRFPLGFEPNQGQTDSRVRFLARGPGYSLFLTSRGAVLSLRERESSTGDATIPAALRLKLLGANPDVKTEGLEQLPGTNNYFTGNDPAAWQTGVPRFARVRYADVYPGVDLVFYGNQGHLEYDFVVAPGADPGVIRFALDGGNSILENRKSKIKNPKPRITLASNGDLIVTVGAGKVRLHKPVVYQEQSPVVSGQLSVAADHEQRTTDKRQFPDGRYVLAANNQVRFEVSAYDRTRPLIIDPVLSYSSYLGGSAADLGYGVAVDTEDNVYVVGSAGSTDFPSTESLQSSNGGNVDAFVAKISADGTSLVYSTYLGGTGFDRGTGIAVDSSGNAYVTGSTTSVNFPTTTGAVQTTFGGGTCGTSPCSDAFAVKLGPAGASLVYSTYLGGIRADSGQGIALDSAGDAFVVGTTDSVDTFPTISPLQSASGGGTDAFVSKLNPGGSSLLYSTFLGGNDADLGQGIAVDSAGNATMTGVTFSTNFPASSPLQAVSGGSGDAFVTRINSTGSAFVYSTYLGGSGLDRGFAVALDSTGNAYVTGDTTSADFPVTAGSFQETYADGGDAFVVKLAASGAATSFATYLGGVDTEQGLAIAPDSSGNVSVTGFTRSSDFPILTPIQETFGGGMCGSAACSDAFVTQLNPAGSALVYSTFLGGDYADVGRGLALDSSADAVIAGSSASANFPVTPGTVQFARGGTGPIDDAFVAKISPLDAPAIALAPQALDFGDHPTGATSDPLLITVTNVGSQALTISDVAATGDYSQTNTCVGALAAAGGNCTISVTFKATEIGTRDGMISITDDAAGSPQVVTLTGNGVTPAPAVNYSPTSLAFGDQTVGTTSDPQTVTMTNSGSADLVISDITIGTHFAQTNDCPDTLAPQAFCTFSVTFAPTVTGDLTAAVSVTSNAAGSPHRANVSGTGIAEFSLSAAEPSVTLDRGTDSTTFTVTLAAPSGFTSSVNLSCTNQGVATCSFNPASITPGQSSTLTISGLNQVTATALDFNAEGAITGQSTATDLSVLFHDFSLSVTPTFASIAAGETAPYVLTLTPTNGFAGTVNLNCGLLPPETTCAFDPATVTLNGTDAVTVDWTVATTLRARIGPPPAPRFPPSWLLLGIGVFSALAYAFRQRLPRALAPATAVLLLALLLSSCGNYGFVDIRGTPSGTFGITVIATSGSAARSSTVALTVN